MAPATINPSKFSLPLGLRLPKSMTLYLETLLLNGAFSWLLTYKVFEEPSLEKLGYPFYFDVDANCDVRYQSGRGHYGPERANAV